MKVRLVDKVEISGIKFFKRGKVRDIYELEGGVLLFVATDRVSCFDVVLQDPIPYKGIVLTQLSIFWFELTENIIKNHIVKIDISEFRQLLPYKDLLESRIMFGEKTTPIPFECVVRGYLAGSAWKDYKEGKAVSGIKLAPGFIEAQKLSEPIFTPSTKEERSHDITVSFDYMRDKIGTELAGKIREVSIKLYQFASEIAENKGIIIADTKFEFGLLDGELILIDELLTPDSSRFWPRDEYRPGRPQLSFDKQYLRDWLESTGWNKVPPPPKLPQDIIERTSQKYLLAYKLLVGKELI